MKQGYKKTKIGVIPQEWEVKKLGEVFDFVKTYSNSRNDLSENGDIEYLHYGDIHTKFKYHLDFDKNILPKIKKTKFKNNIEFVKEGDLFIADASEDYEDIGKSVEAINVKNRKIVSGLHTFLLRDKTNYFANKYKGYILYNKNVKNSIKKIATGISVLGISKTNLSKIQLPLPSLKEQQKIAEILSTWDEAIEKQENLIKEKENLKKGLMQQLLTGKVRFKEFSEEWKEVKLGEISSLKNGYAFKSKEYVKNGKFKVITISNVKNFKLDTNKVQTIDKSPNDIRDFQILQKNDILISMTGNVGRVCLVDKDNCLLNQRVGKIEIKSKNVDINFIYFVLNQNHFEIKMKDLAQGGAQENISKKDIENFKLKLPPLKEQQKIAEVLSTIDKEIELLKEELNELKNQKKGLMQKLLSGEVRVKI